jgi:uncharacterized membrane protein YraQ (UPF0718 family)
VSNKKGNKLNNSLLLIAIFLSLYFVYLLFEKNIFKIEDISTFNTIFLSIIIQAFPFMLIGILVSSIMHVFIPDNIVVKVFPKKFGLGYISAMFLGLLFPVCECAIVPVTRRLIKKGVPFPIALTFMFSAPIINPIVIVSTLYAFPGNPEYALIRVVAGLIVAFLIGLIFMIFFNKNNILLENINVEENCSCCSHEHEEHEHNHEENCSCCSHEHEEHEHNHEENCSCCSHEHEEHEHNHEENCSCCSHEHEEHEHNHEENKSSFVLKLKQLFLHAGEEFFGVGKYLLIGAIITSLSQIIIPKSVFENVSENFILSLAIMMSLAFAFSACSTSDAFLARSYIGKFPIGSILGFLIFGPMMDLKNILMLMHGFKKSFIIKLTFVIVIVNIFIITLLNYIVLN